MKEIERKIIFNKAGGTAGKNSYGYKLSLPVDAVEALGVTLEDRSVNLKIEEGKVIIEKSLHFKNRNRLEKIDNGIKDV